MFCFVLTAAMLALQVESALLEHGGVAEAAVVGFPHDVKGQGACLKSHRQTHTHAHTHRHTHKKYKQRNGKQSKKKEKGDNVSWLKPKQQTNSGLRNEMMGKNKKRSPTFSLRPRSSTSLSMPLLSLPLLSLSLLSLPLSLLRRSSETESGTSG